jgi:predicted DNA-binding transcriptional regulator AlpA
VERKMKQHKIRGEDNLNLDPNQIVRWKDGLKYFGYKHSALAEKIKSGELPRPIPLSDTGRACGWLGSQIIEHQRRMREAAEKRLLEQKA